MNLILCLNGHFIHFAIEFCRTAEIDHPHVPSILMVSVPTGDTHAFRIRTLAISSKLKKTKACKP